MLSKQVGMSIDELEMMTIGGLIDYAHVYADELDRSEEKTKVKEATQDDIDTLLG